MLSTLSRTNIKIASVLYEISIVFRYKIIYAILLKQLVSTNLDKYLLYLSEIFYNLSFEYFNAAFIYLVEKYCIFLFQHETDLEIAFANIRQAVLLFKPIHIFPFLPLGNEHARNWQSKARLQLI